MDKLRQSGSIIRQLKRVQGFHSVTTPVNRGNNGLRASGDLTSQSFVRRPGKVPFGQLRSLIVVVLVIALCSSRSFAQTTKCPPNPPETIMVEIASYEEVKDLPNHPEKVLIDVREPEELKETGQIPTSINIPLATVGDALKLSPEEFEAKYGKAMPKKDQETIFHCKGGGRSQKAAELAKSLGFNNVKNYKGSWMDWAEKNGL